MARDLPLGNGSLTVDFDELYQLRDLYWPFVGQENHTAGHPFRFGVWVDDRFSWVADSGWERTLVYQTGTLVTKVTLRNAELQLTLTCRDVVDFHENLYLRQIDVQNETDTLREVRLFFAQDFHIGGSDVGDSAYYEPERKAVYHYKGKRWFIINVACESAEGWELGVDQWAVGLKELQKYQGTWRDAEDGTLSGHAVAQGSVDSCVALHLIVPPGGNASGWYWIGVGEDFESATRINRVVRQKGPRTFIQRTQYYWSLWLHKHAGPYPDPPPEEAMVQRSLLVMRTQIDNTGAILAATDFAVAQEAHDTYCYVWPRDGALVAEALIIGDHREVSRNFFTFCSQVITEEGYLLHKFNPDGSLASSWLGWYHDKRKELPVQEDETALVLHALWSYFVRTGNVEFIKPFYRGFVVRAANWMLAYRDDETELPLPSWDLWEERRGVFAWTVGATWAGLQAAANFAVSFGETDLAELYRSAANHMRTAVDQWGWDAAEGRFRRTIPLPDASLSRADATLDASIAGLWLFGMYPPDDPRIVATMTALHEHLWVKTSVGGIARYADDRYHRTTEDFANVPGNPWFICTLWLARWYAETATDAAGLAQAKTLLDWAREHALPSGILGEQLDPFTGAPISVCPLTWSHAECVNAMLAYRRAEARLRQG